MLDTETLYLFVSFVVDIANGIFRYYLKQWLQIRVDLPVAHGLEIRADIT